MVRDGKTDADLDRFRAQAPLRRLGRYEEIADAVAYLVSPGASWVSGQILRVNGGRRVATQLRKACYCN
jgi:3-oxoacyl-[acyl-carrier protein] reductase